VVGRGCGARPARPDDRVCGRLRWRGSAVRDGRRVATSATAEPADFTRGMLWEAMASWRRSSASRSGVGPRRSSREAQAQNRRAARMRAVSGSAIVGRLPSRGPDGPEVSTFEEGCNVQSLELRLIENGAFWSEAGAGRCVLHHVSTTR